MTAKSYEEALMMKWPRIHGADYQFDGYSGGWRLERGGPWTAAVRPDLAALAFRIRWLPEGGVRVTVYGDTAREVRERAARIAAVFDPEAPA